MRELKEIDPDQYNQKYLEVQERVQSYKKHRDDRNNELAYQQQQFNANQLKKLPEVIPEWMDTKVQTEDIGKINNFLSSNGFSQNEMSGLSDPRMISALRKAALYDEIQTASLDGNRKTKAPKSSTPGSTNGDKETPELTLAETFYGKS
jgi:uncharacterized protein YcbK (DUF882 family)